MFETPGQRTAGQATALCGLLLIAASCTPTSGQPISAAPAEEEEPEPVAVTVFTEKVELFMEYPRLVPGLEARFLAHVTVLETGEPVRQGELRLELSSNAGGTRTLEASAPARDGLFIPVGVFDGPAKYEAQIVVTSEQVEETIPLDPIVVHPDLATAFAAAEAEVSEEPSDLVPFLLEQQWKVGVLMELVDRRSLTRRLQVPGEIEAPHHAMAVVSAPLGGRLLQPDADRLPSLGERVEKGQVLGYLEPPLTTSDAAQLAANTTSLSALEAELLVREFDIQAKALEVEQLLHQSSARLEFARKALTRLEGLRTKDLGTEAELEEARRDVELAVRESEGAQALKDSFDQARERLETLRSSSPGKRDSGTESTGRRVALIAPISGEVVEADHVEGEYVEPGGAVYRILDLDRVWVAAHVPEFDLSAVGDRPGALMECAAYPDTQFDLLEGLDGRIVNIGRVVDPEARTVALRYEVQNPEGLLRAGMFADIYLEAGRSSDCVIVPEEAIVMDNGRPVAFALVHGEAFQKRYLELGIRDGRFVEILSGIEEGDRVVTKGAYLVKLASASPASFGEGHAH